MSTTYTTNTNLGKPALGDTGWSTPLNSNCDALDALAPVGGLAVALHEVPSASLNVKVAAGKLHPAGRHDRDLCRHQLAGDHAFEHKGPLSRPDRIGRADCRHQLSGNAARPAGDGRRRQLDNHQHHRQSDLLRRRRLDRRRRELDVRHDDRHEDRLGGRPEDRLLERNADCAAGRCGSGSNHRLNRQLGDDDAGNGPQ